MKNKSIIIYLCDYFDEKIINEVVYKIERTIHCPVTLKKFEIDVTNFYYPGRRQYDANKLLKVFSDLKNPCALKKIGLFKVDLFIPILTFIFGQAILNGDTGVISKFRLRNELYGLKRDDNLLAERLAKVFIHELGHMFGLIHCQNPGCVMNSSTYVEHIDQKDQEFCSKCRENLGHNKLSN